MSYLSCLLPMTLGGLGRAGEGIYLHFTDKGAFPEGHKPSLYSSAHLGPSQLPSWSQTGSRVVT